MNCSSLSTTTDKFSQFRTALGQFFFCAVFLSFRDFFLFCFLHHHAFHFYWSALLTTTDKFSQFRTALGQFFFCAVFLSFRDFFLFCFLHHHAFHFYWSALLICAYEKIPALFAQKSPSGRNGLFDSLFSLCFFKRYSSLTHHLHIWGSFQTFLPPYSMGLVRAYEVSWDLMESHGNLVEEAGVVLSDQGQ